jgi:osmotically-inducible protein OsmY
MRKCHEKLKEEVTTELQWEPSINATQVGVAVKNGVVTLTGHLDTYAEKYAIERTREALTRHAQCEAKKM